MRRLVWAFAGRTYHIVGNLMSQLTIKYLLTYLNGIHNYVILTITESRNSKDICSTRVNSKSSMASSCQDLSEQPSPASSQILSNESRLSDISQASKFFILGLLSSWHKNMQDTYTSIIVIVYDTTWTAFCNNTNHISLTQGYARCFSILHICIWQYNSRPR